MCRGDVIGFSQPGLEADGDGGDGAPRIALSLRRRGIYVDHPHALSKTNLLPIPSALLRTPMVDADQIARHLREHPGLIAREVAKALDTTRKEINHYLYQGRGSRFEMDEDRHWYILDQGIPDSEPPEEAGQMSDQVQSRGFALPHVPDEGCPELPGDGSRLSDDQQDRVIQAPCSARLIVEAGPGFGKTDVACARVARLLEDDVSPSRILLLSFTRTAVREMRERIQALSGDSSGIDAVQIRTIDSLAWHLRSDEAGAAPTQTYGQAIQRVLDQLQNPDELVRAAMEDLEHILVDEGQDLVGDRADLLLRIFELLPASTGVTIFHDPAQAIYDWSDDDADPSGEYVGEGEPLAWAEHRMIDKLDENALSFEHVTLTALYRTSDPALRQMFLGARRLVLDDAEEQKEEKLRSVLLDCAPEELLDLKDLASTIKELGEQNPDTLVLFRTTAACLEAASYLNSSAVPHRLRFGGLPRRYPPWIARVAYHAYRHRHARYLSRADFDSAWDRLDEWMATEVGPEEAWELLRRAAKVRGQEEIDLHRLADRLATRSLPEDLGHREIGTKGPILSTIHGSKGREAHSVVLGVLEEPYRANDDDEARVLYVGLSRAKEALKIQRMRRNFWTKGDLGLWHRKNRTKGKCQRFQMELAQEEHMEPMASLQAAGEQSEKQQSALASFSGDILKMKGICIADGSKSWPWRIYADDERMGEVDESLHLGQLSKSYNDALWAVAKRRFTDRRPGSLKFVYWYDVISTAIPREDRRIESMPEPFRSLRMFLSPVFAGIPMICTAPWRH